MFTVLRRRNFALLWSGQLISNIGDWVWLVALPFYVYQLTGSALATGTIFMIETLPRLLLGSVAGVFVDRLNRRWIMIISDALRAMLLLSLLLVHSSGQVWIVYIVALMQTLIAQFFNPAYYATIPKLLGEQDLLVANSLDTLIDAVTRLIGPTLGGALFGFFGIAIVAWLDGFSFLASAFSVLLIVEPRLEPAALAAPLPQGRSGLGVLQALVKFRRQWQEGLHLVVRDRNLLALFSSTGLLMLGQGMITAISVIFVRLILHGDTILLGWLIAAQGLGSLLGTLLVGRFSKRLQPSFLILLGISVAGPLLFLWVNVPALPVVFASRVLGGACAVCATIGSRTLIQQTIADEFRGRVFGFYGTTFNGLMLLGLALSSMLGDRLSVVLLFNIAAVMACVAVLPARLLLRRGR